MAGGPCFIQNIGRGGVRGGCAGGGRAPGRMSLERGGWAKYFFSGPKCPPRQGKPQKYQGFSEKTPCEPSKTL